MSFLLDTNVVSEWTRPNPNPGVMDWLADADEDRVHLSVVTIAELRHGIERLPNGARRTRLDTWLTDTLSARFEARILPVDRETANIWGRLMARSQAIGRPLGAMDCWIAAVAARNELRLVTRNVADFAHTGLAVINPWVSGDQPPTATSIR